MPVINGLTNLLLTSTVDAYFDPQVEFEEVGVSVNGQQTWKLLGPDLDGHYGSLQGVGGLEATVQTVGGQTLTTPVLNDYCGNVLAAISGASVTWNPVRVGGYGPVPGYQAATLTGGTPLANTLVWRSRGIDPSGFYNLGARYYDPQAGHFLSPDPLGHGTSMDLYSFCGGDPLNRFDPTGRFAKDPAGATGRLIQGFAAGMTDPADSSGVSGYGGFISQTGAARLGYNLGNNLVSRLLITAASSLVGGEGVTAVEEAEATMAGEGLELGAESTLAREAEIAAEESEAAVPTGANLELSSAGEDAISESAAAGEEANIGSASLSAAGTESGSSGVSQSFLPFRKGVNYSLDTVNNSLGTASVPSAGVETGGAAESEVEQMFNEHSGNQWSAVEDAFVIPGRGANNPKVSMEMRYGNQAHADLAVLVNKKPGWVSNPTLIGKSGNTYVPDAMTPRGYLIDFKPNTITGRAAGEEKIKLYETELGRKTRIVYYDE